MENKKRIFVSNNFTDGMLKQAKNQGYMVQCSTSSLEELRNEGENIICSLKNRALVGTLVKKGIPAVINSLEITLEKGDTIYVLDPGGRIHDLEDQEELPDYMTITVGKYEIK